MSVWLWLLAIHVALIPSFAVSVLRRRREPTGQLAWLLSIVLIPGLGMTAYWLFGSNRIARKAGRRRRRVSHLISGFRTWTAERAGAAPGMPLALPEDLLEVERLARRLAENPVTGGNEVVVWDDANRTYAALEDALRSARRHIHMLYYIWQCDQTGTHFRDLVIERARQGIECRVLLDAVGCLTLNQRFLDPLIDAGVEVAFFLPLYPTRRRLTFHLRNHRKIVVVDGRTAFLGSQNIGDEYRGRRKKLSPWHDAHMRVRGPAALFCQQTFAEDWAYATRQQLLAESYFPTPEPCGDSLVQIVPTGPDQQSRPLEQIVFAAVSSAHASIRIATPYFVPGPEVRMALAHACYRGVDVRIVLPTRTDSRLALWAARSFYEELLEAGVSIFEYGQGVLHSKLMTVDNRWAMVGSANMDVRSFRLNFEITALIYDPAVALEQSLVIDRYCQLARPVTLRDVRSRPMSRELLEGAARLFTPLL